MCSKDALEAMMSMYRQIYDGSNHIWAIEKSVREFSTNVKEEEDGVTGTSDGESEEETAATGNA